MPEYKITYRRPGEATEDCLLIAADHGGARDRFYLQSWVAMTEISIVNVELHGPGNDALKHPKVEPKPLDLKIVIDELSTEIGKSSTEAQTSRRKGDDDAADRHMLRAKTLSAERAALIRKAKLK